MARRGWANKMRAVKIDPARRTVTEIDLKKKTNRTLDELYSIIGCDLVELVELDRGIIMVVDESVFAQGYAPTREGKCKIVRGTFTFIGSGMIIAGTAIILGGDRNKLKALPENLTSFQMITEWVEPADVPPPQHTIITFQL